MPVISRFYGIVIKMYFLQAEHNPPHVHAIYGDDAVAIDIRTNRVIDGAIPTKALGLVQEWIDINRKDLLEMWKTQQFVELPPLV